MAKKKSDVAKKEKLAHVEVKMPKGKHKKEAKHMKGCARGK